MVLLRYLLDCIRRGGGDNLKGLLGPVQEEMGGHRAALIDNKEATKMELDLNSTIAGIARRIQSYLSPPCIKIGVHRANTQFAP